MFENPLIGRQKKSKLVDMSTTDSSAPVRLDLRRHAFVMYEACIKLGHSRGEATYKDCYDGLLLSALYSTDILREYENERRTRGKKPYSY